MERPGAILLLGPTGSGKTPLGQLLEARGLRGRSCRHFDFGEQLRRAVSAAAPPAYLTAQDVRFLRGVLQSGALLEDEHFHVAEAILRAFLEELPAVGRPLVVLNGLPRHAGQAGDVDAIVAVEAVIELSCTPETVFERIRTDAGGDRAPRTDDDVAAVRNKLELYARRTAPLLEHYRGQGVGIECVEVGPDTSARDVWTRLQPRKDAGDA